MRAYVHRPQTEVLLIEGVAETATPADLIEIDAEEFVFLDDHEEPIEVDITIVEILRRLGHQPGHHHHIHRHPCRHVTTIIHYNAVTIELKFSPNTIIGTVLTNAVDKFRIDPVNAADLVLRAEGTSTDLPDSDYLGSLTTASCTVELDLLPARREAG